MNPKFNMDGAEQIVGRQVVIDVDVRDYDERPVERRELHGTITRVTEDEGIVVRLEPSGHKYILPPDLDRLEPLGGASYTLTTTGETIENADLKTSLVIHLPPPELDR